eukprot:TRINITY_DN2444_c0_g1_i1.p1 TRINITY_DN2444_c0_g1~~TRINITY_DN2444_c0_g1_i1.p1  ORF type:complete len:222 (-),score=37.21 TRINITY_DN2444_c0_g1_i1:156-821(-)
MERRGKCNHLLFGGRAVLLLWCLWALSGVQEASCQGLRGLQDVRSCSKETNGEGIPLCKGIWEDCGSLFNVTDVRIQTFRRPGQRRIPLFHGTKTRICISGFATNSGSSQVTALQNAAHGEILGVKTDFCDIPKDGCAGIEGGCPLAPGGAFEYCSTLNVPDVAVKLDVNVYWRVLQVPSTVNTCQKDFDTDKPILVCLKVPTSLKSKKFLREIVAARRNG